MVLNLFVTSSSSLQNRILGSPILGRLCLMTTYVWMCLQQNQGAPSRLWDAKKPRNGSTVNR